jgi:hypothetical protein
MMGASWWPSRGEHHGYQGVGQSNLVLGLLRELGIMKGQTKRRELQFLLEVVLVEIISKSVMAKGKKIKK